MNARTAPPSEAELVAHAVRELSRRTGFPVAFGGLFRDGEVAITAVHGARTRSLEGLRVHPQRGLGGRAVVELRPRMTSDYGASRSITHDYDRAILGEGIATLLAVPIIVEGIARGVLYGGSWSGQPLGEVNAAPAFQVAEALASELRVRDEVERRVRMLGTTAPLPVVSDPLPVAHREELRSIYASLRPLINRASESDAQQLRVLSSRLASLAGDHLPAPGAETPRLAPREVDVLACAALGGTNADIARQLGLKPGTVKAYLATAMSKLAVSTRLAAVTEARRAGIIP